jgi:hypothetical protein
MRPDLIPAMQPNTNPRTESAAIKTKSSLLLVKRKTLMPSIRPGSEPISCTHRWPRNICVRIAVTEVATAVNGMVHPTSAVREGEMGHLLHGGLTGERGGVGVIGNTADRRRDVSCGIMKSLFAQPCHVSHPA